MEKKITYKGKEYTIEIRWSGSSYCVRVIGVGGFYAIPFDCLDDIEKIKPHIIEAIQAKHELSVIAEWDGNLDGENEMIGKWQNVRVEECDWSVGLSNALKYAGLDRVSDLIVHCKREGVRSLLWKRNIGEKKYEEVLAFFKKNNILI